MARLYVLSGLPGSGKSTFCKQNNDKAIHVSRDVIRFSLLKEGEDYFSHEKEVTNIFWSQINCLLKQGKDVFADQTSLTMTSRGLLLSHIEIPCEKILMQFQMPIKICIERNEKRKGTRAYVPPSVIHNMNRSFTEPQEYERFDKVYIVDENFKQKKVMF